MAVDTAADVITHSIMTYDGVVNSSCRQRYNERHPVVTTLPSVINQQRVSRQRYCRSKKITSSRSKSSCINSWFRSVTRSRQPNRLYCYCYSLSIVVIWCFCQINSVRSDDITTNIRSNSPVQSSPSNRSPMVVPSIPTTVPTTTLQPQLATTVTPTRNLITIRSPRLAMTLINMEQNIGSNNDTVRQWRNLTSQHVRQFWNTNYNTTTTTSNSTDDDDDDDTFSNDDNNQAPFYIGRVVTTIISETRTTIVPEDHFIVDSTIIINRSSQQNNTTTTVDDGSNNNNNSSVLVATLPDRLEIIYTQEITYLEQPSGDASFFNFQNSDIFTIPFEQDGMAYTTQLRSITSNPYILFLVYTGVIPDEEIIGPVLSNPSDRKLVISVVTVVVAVIVAACVYIYCLLKRRQQEPQDSSIQHNNRSVAGGGGGVIVENGSPELLLTNQNGELPPLVEPSTITATVPTLLEGTHQYHHNNPSTNISNNNNENVIVCESYDDEYPLPESTIPSNQQQITDDLVKKQNISRAINQPLLPPFVPPLSAMESRTISNLTDSGSLQLLQQHQSIFNSNHKNNSVSSNNMDPRASPLLITASHSRDFEVATAASEPFMLNPSYELSSLHQLPMIGTPSRFGMVTMTIPSTVSDLDMNETTPMNDLQDSPLPFRGVGSDDNNNSHYNNIYSLPSGGTGGYEGYHISNNDSSDPDYAPPPSPLIMGISGGVDDYILDQYNINNSQYPHEQPDDLDMQQQQQLDEIYHDGSITYDDNRNTPTMTGFQLEIQDLE